MQRLSALLDTIAAKTKNHKKLSTDLRNEQEAMLGLIKKNELGIKNVQAHRCHSTACNVKESPTSLQIEYTCRPILIQGKKMRFTHIPTPGAEDFDTKSTKIN